MANKQVNAFGKRRAEIDIRRLAEALLDYIDSLSETEKRKLSREGKTEHKKNLGSPSKAKGSAA
jgi:hypothetical protein